MATEENNSRLQAELVQPQGNEQDWMPTVNITDKGKPVGRVIFGKSTTSVTLENSYMNWSRQVVRLARATAGV